MPSLYVGPSTSSDGPTCPFWPKDNHIKAKIEEPTIQDTEPYVKALVFARCLFWFRMFLDQNKDYVIATLEELGSMEHWNIDQYESPYYTFSYGSVFVHWYNTHILGKPSICIAAPSKRILDLILQDHSNFSDDALSLYYPIGYTNVENDFIKSTGFENRVVVFNPTWYQYGKSSVYIRNLFVASCTSKLICAQNMPINSAVKDIIYLFRRKQSSQTNKEVALK